MIRARRRRRKRDSIDEYDLGERFKRWSKQTASQVAKYVLVHPKTVVYSSLGVLALGVTWWFVANYRPAEPPAPRTRPMQQMMQAVEEADKRVRTQRGETLQPAGEFRGVFETMRDMPVPLSTESPAGGNNAVTQVSEDDQ